MASTESEVLGTSDEAEISVTTLAGATHVVKVPCLATASAVRAAVAAALTVPMIEVGLLDNATGEKMRFGTAVPLATLPHSLTFIRSKNWAHVPDGCHHPDLAIAEDRAKASVSDKLGHQGFFLSEPLERGKRYSITVRLEGERRQVWLGATRDDATKWTWIPGAFVGTPDGKRFASYVDSIDEWAGAHGCRGVEWTTDAALASCIGVSGASDAVLVVDTAAGALEVLAKDGSVAASRKIPQLAEEHSLRFCASLYYPGQSLTVIDANVM